MLDLIQQYSVSEIIIFIVILALAVKSFVDFVDWAKGKINNAFNIRSTKDQDKKNIIIRLDKDEEKMDKLLKIYNEQNHLIQILIESDKDDIKSWITEQHHKFCYTKSKSIDAYSLDCIERRYNHYKDEGGNSFVSDLMNDLRNLNVYYPEQGIQNIDSEEEK
jgi:hypothetical protein